MAELQTILNLAAEGGGLTIFGATIDGRWRFQLVTDDHTPTLIDEKALQWESGWVNSLSEALSQIEWPWNRFHPIVVHTEFADEFLKLKKKKGEVGPANS